jgi:hypothetical protein
MKDDISLFSADADPELGEALRTALAPHFPEAFVGRVMARLAQRQPRSWDEQLAQWFWRGLVAASLVIAVAGWGYAHVGGAVDASDVTVASQLLDGSQPMADIVMASLTQDAP